MVKKEEEKKNSILYYAVSVLCLIFCVELS